MSRRDPLVRLKHMLDYAREAVEMAEGKKAEDLWALLINWNKFVPSSLKQQNWTRPPGARSLRLGSQSPRLACAKFLL